MANKKVLIVDDEALIRDMLSDLLEAFGYEVEMAEDGQKGFELASTQDFFAIFMDMKMPNWNGVDAANSLDLVGNNLKIIVVTGYVEESEYEIIKDNKSVIGLFKKPFDFWELSNFLKHISPFND